VGFGFFKKKSEDELNFEPYVFKDDFESLYAFFVEQHPEDLEHAMKEFERLTGKFDDEHENFNSKMDDFRTWFVLFYNFSEKPHYMLEKAKLAQKEKDKLSDIYKKFSTSTSSVFKILKIKKNQILLKDLIYKQTFKVEDSLQALTLEEGGFIQTTVFKTSETLYTMAFGVVSHPNEARVFILKQIKNLLKKNKKTKDNIKLESFSLMQELMSMRYQLFKYKQVSVDKVYNKKPIIKSGV
jgi:hypothetical protein